MQVYLPDAMYAQVKEAGISPSELLQQAVRAELRNRELAEATDVYLAELRAEVGEPTPADVAYLRELMRQIRGEEDRAAG